MEEDLDSKQACDADVDPELPPENLDTVPNRESEEIVVVAVDDTPNLALTLKEKEVREVDEGDTGQSVLAGAGEVGQKKDSSAEEEPERKLQKLDVLEVKSVSEEQVEVEVLGSEEVKPEEDSGLKVNSEEQESEGNSKESIPDSALDKMLDKTRHSGPPGAESSAPPSSSQDSDMGEEDASRDGSSVTDASASDEKSGNGTEPKVVDVDETSMDSSVCSGMTSTSSTRRTRNAEKPKGSTTYNFNKPRPTSASAAATAAKNKFVRDKALFDEMKFMADFDPRSSNRIRDKKRKRYTDGRPQVIADHYEDCDCLIKDCPGCHYPCKKCGDPRCGHECRQGRRWLYESIEVEGRGIERRNPHVEQQ